MNTYRNVHSHSIFDSPVSRRQEVSGYGDHGEGDGGIYIIITFEHFELIIKYFY